MEIKEFIEKFAEQIEVMDVDTLKPETEFRSLDEWSYLCVMILIAFYDDEFNKQIGETAIDGCETIEDLYKLATA